MPPVRAGPVGHAAQLPVGTLQTGSDGHSWVVLPTARSRRWVRLVGRVRRCILRSNDGQRLAMVSDTAILVFEFGEQPRGMSNKQWVAARRPERLVFHLKKYKRLWLGGQSSLPRSTVLAEVPGGASPLGPLARRWAYVYLDGSNAQAFHTASPVLAYEAPIGNNSVPYPVARTRDRVYLLAEACSLQWDAVRTEDPYRAFYADPRAAGAPLKLVQLSK